MATAEESVIIPVRLDHSPASHVGVHEDDADALYLDTSAVEPLTPTEVVLLGYWPVPDQSSPQQLRDQFEDEALERLEAVRKPLEDRGFDVTSDLSFTKDRDHLIDRAANKHGCKSVLSPGVSRSGPPDSVLVLLKSDSDLDRIVSTLGTLLRHSSIDILLFHALESGDDVEVAEYMLNGVANRLEAQGIPPDRIRWEQSERGSRVETIVSEASNHDLIVLSESEPTVRERIFGPVQSAVSDRTDRPSLTIRAGT